MILADDEKNEGYKGKDNLIRMVGLKRLELIAIDSHDLKIGIDLIGMVGLKRIPLEEQVAVVEVLE
jgi:hypothetical protein